MTNQQTTQEWRPSLDQAQEGVGVAKGTTRTEILRDAEARKDDSGKPRLDLLPPELMLAVGGILTSGAARYGERNWEQGMNWGRVYAALLRHMLAWWSGEEADHDTGKSHLHHAGACLAFLIAYEQRGVGTDDRPGAGE